MSKYLGQNVKPYTEPNAEILDWFSVEYKYGCEIIMATEEVTALCPQTHQPDFYEVAITYVPFDNIVESKALKLYLQSFRNYGILAEDFAQRILDDLYSAIEPESIEVTVEQIPRGGISIRATAKKNRS